ncbi:MAG: DUF1598 domain-containing protein [Thermoguttaceae bacterium]
MRRQALGLRMPVLLAALTLVCFGLLAGDAWAQQNNNNNGGGGGGGGTNNNNNGGGNNNNVNVTGGQAGVYVDAQGVLRRNVVPDPTGMLRRQQVAAAQASLPRELSRQSELRKISLTRLEKALSENGGALNDEMRYLAGLQRLRYVFLYPESGDIVIAGPAEGWASESDGRMTGLRSGRPVLQLQDLVVALRAFPPDQTKTQMVGCSIDPTQEGLASMQRFLQSTGRHATPAQTQYLANGLRSSLGLQNVRVDGVPADTRFAQVLVEADYRMKMIGIGLERPNVRTLKSFVDLASPSQVSRNALSRWYFVPDYQCVRSSNDGMAMELVGDGVRLVGEQELVSSEGSRAASSGGNRASKAFVTSFTESYAQLAAQSPVYAELRNLIDMLVASAYIQQQDMYHKAGWEMPVLGSEEKFPVRLYNPPTQVESAVNAVWKGNTLMTPIGGGVQIEAETALDPENVLADEEGKVAELRGKTGLKLAPGQWWWD